LVIRLLFASGAGKKERMGVDFLLFFSFDRLWMNILFLLKWRSLAAFRHINKSISAQSTVFQSKAEDVVIVVSCFLFEQTQKKKQRDRKKRNNNKKITSPQVPALVKTVSKLPGGH